MRRIFFISLFAILATCSVNAQVTFNVRAGACVYLSADDSDTMGGGQFVFQSNIPFGDKQDWTFSPTIEVKSKFSENVHLVLPLQLGHKFSMGHRTLLIPKVGIALGYNFGDDAPIVGPSIEFAFEIGHFIVAIDGYYSIARRSGFSPHWGFDHNYRNVNSAGISFGYKF